MKKVTAILLAEIEIEDEGFTTDCIKEQIAAGKVKHLRPASTNELQDWNWYLLPRLTKAKPCHLALSLENDKQGKPIHPSNP